MNSETYRPSAVGDIVVSPKPQRPCAHRPFLPGALTPEPEPSAPGFWEEMIDLELLRVDGGYQRRLSETKVGQLLPYDVSSGGALLCNLRADGTRYVIDGQHRAEAGRRSGYSHLPGRVVQVSREREARFFIEMNWATLTVSARDKFRADVVAGEPEARAILATIEACGFVLAYEPHGGADDVVSAVDACRAICRTRGGVRRAAGSFDAERLRATLELVRATWPGQPGNGAGTLLRAVALVRQKARGSLDEGRFAEKLFVYTPLTLLKAGAVAAKAHGASSVVGTADKIIEEYNTKLPRASKVALPRLLA